MQNVCIILYASFEEEKHRERKKNTKKWKKNTNYLFLMLKIVASFVWLVDY